MNHPTGRRAILGGAKAFLASIPLLALASAPGCGEAERPRDASPIVSPESEAGQKAIADTEKLLKLRKEQEAASRRRHRGLPVEG